MLDTHSYTVWRHRLISLCYKDVVQLSVLHSCHKNLFFLFFLKMFYWIYKYNQYSNHEYCRVQILKEKKKKKKIHLSFGIYFSRYCIRHIFRGVFIFANFASRVLFANLSTRENIYLRSRRMNATCVRNTLLSSIANLTTRENVLKSRFAKIYGVYSILCSNYIKMYEFCSAP